MSFPRAGVASKNGGWQVVFCHSGEERQVGLLNLFGRLGVPKVKILHRLEFPELRAPDSVLNHLRVPLGLLLGDPLSHVPRDQLSLLVFHLEQILIL